MSALGGAELGSPLGSGSVPYTSSVPFLARLYTFVP